MKAALKHNRQAPRKVRIVADLIRGKSVNEALTVLRHTTKKATHSLEKLVESAVANAKSGEARDEKNLYIKKITVDKGFTMKRHMPKWRGTADPIRKHTSIIAIELEERKEENKTKTTNETEEPVAKEKAPAK
jgi:large subunit ribosomal protein L22